MSSFAKFSSESVAHQLSQSEPEILIGGGGKQQQSVNIKINNAP